MSQLHKRFTSDQVKELLERYSKNEIERKYIQAISGIKKIRLFMLLYIPCPDRQPRPPQ
jgi:hypothetical protein